MRIRKPAFFLLLLLISVTAAHPFGRNKVSRDSYDWVVLKSVHFDICYPRGMDEAGLESLQIAEEAYRSISVRLKHEMTRVIPVIMFPFPAAFQGNCADDSIMGGGAGGFTEFFKNRIIVPFSPDKDLYRYILTHEIAHAFEYDLLFSGRTFPLFRPRFSDIPLWMMEGLAEYLSLGYDCSCDDVMRDCFCNAQYSDLSCLSSGRVRSVYLFKEAQLFFFFLESSYGPDAIPSLFVCFSQKHSFADSLTTVTGKNIDDLNREWIRFGKSRYCPVGKDKRFDEDTGILCIRHTEDAFIYNTSSAVSPDGKKIAFLTSRPSCLSVSIMDSSTKKEQVIKTLVTGENHSSVETLHSELNSLSWSSDGRLLCFAAQAYGRQSVYLINPESGSVVQRIDLPFDDIQSPVVSPDGKFLSFVGSIGTRTDLFLYIVDEKKVTRLTDDELMKRTPVFTPDSSFVIYASDAGEMHADRALMKVSIAGGTPVKIISDGRCDHPDISSDGKTLIYISDKTGIRNLYRYNFETGKTERLTDILFGLTSPKFLSDGKTIAYVAYQNSGFYILVRKSDAPLPDQSERHDQTLVPAVFSPSYRPYSGIGLSPYAPNLSQDMIVGTIAGGVSSSGFVGMAMLKEQVSDRMCDYRINGALEYSGYDRDQDGLNAEASFFYLKNRIDLGAGIFVQNSPYEIVSLDMSNQGLHNVYGGTESFLRYGVYAEASYPLTCFLRADFKATFSQYEWKYDEKADPSANLNTIASSLSFDNVAWGGMYPLYGWRGRFSVEQAVNITGQDYSYTAFNADVRRYVLFGSDCVLALHGSGGKVVGKDSAGFKYFLGGFDTLRGFGWGDIEGSNMFFVQAELCSVFIEGSKFGFPFFSGVGGIGGVLFVDAGSAWDGNFHTYDHDGKFQDFKIDAGFGFRIALMPFVCLKLDFAWPYNSKSFGSENTLFSIGMDF